MIGHDKVTEVKTLTDPFAEFRKQAESAFRFLVSEYKFQALGESRAGHEITLRFQKGKIFIAIYYEWGGAPGIGVGRIALNEIAATHELGISLERLLRDRAPNVRLKVKLDKTAWPQFPLDEIPALLNKYAAILQEYFPDLLDPTMAASEVVNSRCEENQGRILHDNIPSTPAPSRLRPAKRRRGPPFASPKV